MSGAFDEGVAGGTLALVFAAFGNSALALTSVPVLYRESAPAVAAGLTLALACAGGAAGIGLVRLVQRPADRTEADGREPIRPD